MKTVIYNIGTLAGILPQGKLKLEGAEMNHVECIENAYVVIEDGVIKEFGPTVISSDPAVISSDCKDSRNTLLSFRATNGSRAIFLPGINNQKH